MLWRFIHRFSAARRLYPAEIKATKVVDVGEPNHAFRLWQTFRACYVLFRIGTTLQTAGSALALPGRLCMSFEEAEPRYRDEALAECARAAVSWYSRRDDAEKRVASVRRGMAWAARANDGAPPARTLTEFLSLLRRPVTEWLAGVPGPPLAEEDAPSEFALDILAETGGPYANPEAEMVQARIGDARKGFALRIHGEAEYRAFRRFVIEHGHASVEEAQVGLLAAGMAPPDLFEDIPLSCRIRSDRGDVFYPCPRCRWPMIRFQQTLQCASLVCQSEGSRFRDAASHFQPLGKRDLSTPVASAGRLRLRRGVWRYTLQPGLVELDLEKRIRRIPGVSVELWPERDRYDLKVRMKKSTWLVDVKDWSRAPALAQYFLRCPPSDQLIVVLPDWRSEQLAGRTDHFCITQFDQNRALRMFQESTDDFNRPHLKGCSSVGSHRVSLRKCLKC